MSDQCGDSSRRQRSDSSSSNSSEMYELPKLIFWVNLKLKVGKG